MTRRADTATLKAMPIHERVTFLRVRRALSHDSYAQLLGTSRGRVIAWEHPPGHRRHSEISDKYVQRLADLENLPAELFRPSPAERFEAVIALGRRVDALEREFGALASDVRALLGEDPDPGDST